MNKKLISILKFLENNKSYNTELQIKYMQRALCSKATKKEKLIALLYETANTQSQPKIDKLCLLFKKIYQSQKTFETFHEFLTFLDLDNAYNHDKPYQSLYEALKNQSGWGPKTSALFVKNMYNLHHNDEFKKVFGTDILWNDFPKLQEEDKIYLPVDTVILAIFNKLEYKKPKWNFKNINSYLKSEYSNKNIIQFDDLWFWGFISQKNKAEHHIDKEYWDGKREMCWNEEKYWMITEVNKDEEYMKVITKKVEEFLKLFRNLEND